MLLTVAVAAAWAEFMNTPGAHARLDAACAELADPGGERHAPCGAPPRNEVSDDRDRRRHGRSGRRCAWSRCRIARGKLLGTRGADRHDRRPRAAGVDPRRRRHPAEPASPTRTGDRRVFRASICCRCPDQFVLAKHRQPSRRQVPGTGGARVLRTCLSNIAAAGSTSHYRGWRRPLPGFLAATPRTSQRSGRK